jgi:outer membrane protein OmpA-like peptidoglycan-associated protein
MKLCLATSIVVTLGLGACAHQRAAAVPVEQKNARAEYVRAAPQRAEASAPLEPPPPSTGVTEAQTQPQDPQVRLRQVREDVSKISSTTVRDDRRGMVISVQSEMLFDTGEADLRPDAVCQLDQIAGALRGLDRPIAVLGNTDGTGPRARNMELSQDQARVVRDYLVSRGISEDGITAKGIGPDHPVAENATVEGRALNRRVEIIVAPRLLPK